jgi:hypothetical protein
VVVAAVMAAVMAAAMICHRRVQNAELSFIVIFCVGYVYCVSWWVMPLCKLLTPPPTPPLQGRGAAAALTGAWNSVGTPLPCRGGVGGGVSNLHNGISPPTNTTA